MVVGLITRAGRAGSALARSSRGRAALGGAAAGVAVDDIPLFGPAVDPTEQGPLSDSGSGGGLNFQAIFFVGILLVAGYFIIQSEGDATTIIPTERLSTGGGASA